MTIHARTLRAHGGTEGLRDERALESALMAPLNRHLYEQADVVACAATYAYHLTQAHAFVDGNKRVAAGVMEVFLLINDFQLNADNAELEALFLGIAAGQISRDTVESQLRPWVLPESDSLNNRVD